MKTIVRVLMVTALSTVFAYSYPANGMMGEESEMMNESNPEIGESSPGMMDESLIHQMGMNKMKVDKNSPLYVTYIALKEQKVMMHIAHVNLFKLQYMRKVLTAAEATNLEDMRRDIVDLHQQFFAALKEMEKGPVDADRLTDIHTKFMDKAHEFRKMLSSIKAKAPQMKMKMQQRIMNPNMKMQNQQQMPMEQGMKNIESY